MSTDSNESGVYKGMLTLDGKKENYQNFMLKFKANANAKGFLSVLTLNAALPADSRVDGLTVDQNKLVKANIDALCAYTMALVGDDVFDIITSSFTTEYHHGLAHLITAELDDQFKPDDGTSKIEYMNALSSVSMGKDSDPAKLFNKLAKIKTAYNSATNIVQESELVMTVVRVAPAKYSETIKKVMKAKGNSLTVKDMKKEMIEHCTFLIAREEP